jgi:hypothetical protein
VSIDLFTSDDLELIRQNQQIPRNVPSSKSSTKRYLILIYNAEFDRIYYPLSLRYCGKPDPAILIEQIRQLATENQFLKSQVNTFILKDVSLILSSPFSLNRILDLSIYETSMNCVLEFIHK